MLDLQTLVAEQVTRSSSVLARLREAQEHAMGGLLTRDTAPVWNAAGWADVQRALSDRADMTLGRGSEVASYVRDPSHGLLLHLMMFAALAAVFLAGRRSIRRQGGAGDHGPPGVMAFDRPYASALAVTLLIASAPISTVPPAILTLFEVVALVPVIRVTRPAMDPWLVPGMFTLAMLFVVDAIRQSFGGVPVIEPLILMLEMLIGAAVLAYALARGELRRRPLEAADAERLQAFRVGATLLLLLFAVTFVGAAVGYMRLARLLGAGLLGSGALALSIFAVLRVATGLVAFILRVWPFRLLWMVQHHRDFLERRARVVMTWLAAGGWATRALAYVGLLQPVLTTGATLPPSGDAVGAGFVSLTSRELR